MASAARAFAIEYEGRARRYRARVEELKTDSGEIGVVTKRPRIGECGRIRWKTWATGGLMDRDGAERREE